MGPSGGRAKSRILPSPEGGPNPDKKVPFKSTKEQSTGKNHRTGGGLILKKAALAGERLLSWTEGDVDAATADTSGPYTKRSVRVQKGKRKFTKSALRGGLSNRKTCKVKIFLHSPKKKPGHPKKARFGEERLNRQRMQGEPLIQKNSWGPRHSQMVSLYAQ